MYKILIDSTKRREKVVTIIKNVDGDEVVVSKKEGDLDIVKAIMDILEENGIKKSEISEIASNLGPGSFTGLKIGVTIANIFNWALGNKKVNEMDTPEYGRDPNITLKKFS
ncbi:hypothetical protein ACFLZK_00275 [Patescibacteria group bacterium]